MTAANYLECFAFTGKYEGGRADNPHDPGGRTMAGVTQAAYDAWRRKQGLPVKNVFDSLPAERAQIFREMYWEKAGCDQLPSGVDLCVFDFAVNSGPARALGVLRRCGGPKQGARQLIHDICAYRLSFLHGLRTWRYFGRGWGARVAACEARALTMCTMDPNTALKVARNGAEERRDTVGSVAAIAAGAGISLTSYAPSLAWGLLIGSASAAVMAIAAFKSWRHGQRADAFNKELQR
jgi:lysozyme family protein